MNKNKWDENWIISKFMKRLRNTITFHTHISLMNVCRKNDIEIHTNTCKYEINKIEQRNRSIFFSSRRLWNNSFKNKRYASIQKCHFISKCQFIRNNTFCDNTYNKNDLQHPAYNIHWSFIWYGKREKERREWNEVALKRRIDNEWKVLI